MGGVLQNLEAFREIIFFEDRSKRDYWIRFGMFLTISAVIATIGMLRDSIAVVIAASQQISENAVAEGKTEIQPNCVSNYPGWEPMSGIRDFAHLATLPSDEIQITPLL
jgi:hypothetical protein